MAPANQVCPCSDLDFLQAFVFEGDGLPSGCLVWHVRGPVAASCAAEQRGALSAQHPHNCSGRLVIAPLLGGEMAYIQ